MTSPAETYAEHEAERRAAARRSLAQRQLEGLHTISSTCGFGSSSAPTFAEREIHRHLNAALALCHLVVMSEQARVRPEPKPATFDTLEAMARDWPELRAMFSRSTGGIDVDALVAFLDKRI